MSSTKFKTEAELIQHVFSDGRTRKAIEKREQELERLTREQAELQTLMHDEENAAYNRYLEEKHRIHEEYRSQIDAYTQPIRDTRDEIRDVARKLAEKAVERLQKHFEGHFIIKSVELQRGISRRGDYMIHLEMKEVTVIKREHPMWNTTGYLEVALNTDGEIVWTNLNSHGSRHPHGTCLNTAAYDLLDEGRLGDAALDLAQALAVSTH